MFPKPKGFTRVGIIQCFLALFFVIWFLFLPQQGIYFAWPVKPPLTALFLAAGFMLRSYLGFHLWREKDWYPLRWSIHGDYVFLGVLFIATWWHINEMNWHLENAGDGLRIFSLAIAHIWILAYTFEPLTIFLLSPRQPEASMPLPESLSEGPILPAMKGVLVGFFYLGIMVWALLFFNTEFANMRWPWELNAFDSRIMSAWPAACAVWAISMYCLKDWAEVKVGVRALLIFTLALFVIWMFTFMGYDPLRKNSLTYGVVSGLAALSLLYAYWKQETARQKIVPSGELSNQA